MPDELAIEVPHDLRPAAGRRPKTLRPARDLVVDVGGGEIRKAPLDEHAVHVGRRHLGDDHVRVRAVAQRRELRRHVAGLLYRPGARAEEIDKRLRGVRRSDMPARGAAPAAKELADLSCARLDIAVRERRAGDAPGGRIRRRPLPGEHVGAIDRFLAGRTPIEVERREIGHGDAFRR